MRVSDPQRREAARALAARQLALDCVLAEIVRVFEPLGVRALLLKGPAFARWLYDDPSQRPYGDIDLLIAPEWFATASRGLAGCGFEPWQAGWHPHEVVDHHEIWLRREQLPACVELHHTLHLVPAPRSLVWQRLSEGAQAIEVAGARIETPGPAASALIVAVHAMQGGHPRHVRDVRQALARVDWPTWQAASTLAQELGALEPFAAGLRIDPGGCELAQRLGLGTYTSSRALRLRASTPPYTALGIERLVSTPGAGARLRLLGHKLIPSRAFMRARYPLARRRRGGLIAAYTYRPFVLAAKLPRGSLAWLRAARQQR